MPYTREQIERTSSQLRRWYFRDGRFEEYAMRTALRWLRSHEDESQWAIAVALNAVSTIECDSCGEVIGYVNDEGEDVYRYEDEVVIECGHVWCSYDCAHNDGYDYCTQCGEWHQENDMVYVEDAGVFCDSYCAERYGCFRCEHCEEWRYGDSDYVSGEQWCDDCVQHDARWCDRCQRSYPEDEVCYHEETDQDLCDGCYERVREDNDDIHLHSYGWTPILRWYGSAVASPYLGVELETDGGSRRGAYVRELQALCVDGKEFGEHFWMTGDGSLQNGVEITGHPMTLSYHVALAPMYSAISKTANGYGFKSHDGGRCGLHIHVNRSFFGKSRAVQDAGGYKMMRLLQRYERAFTMFSRREDNHWCNYHTSCDYTPKKDEVKISHHVGERKLFDKAWDMACETRHEQALNFQHSETFEFRIFRGTLKWETYYACLALVNGMCHTAKAHGSTWVETVSWYDLMDEVVSRVDEPTAKKHLEDYLEAKGLR